MIITSLMGGLGNQMFQYALGRIVSLRLDTELCLDLSWFDAIASQDTSRRYMLGDAFSVTADRASAEECDRLRWRKEHPAQKLLRWLRRRPRPTERTYVLEPHYAYWPGIEAVTAPTYLSGYWQDERYFASVAADIRHDFAFPPLPAGGAETMARHLQNAGNAVAVHVRRGDYVSNPVTHQFHGVCPSEYYSKALESVLVHADAEPEFFLFSDDPVWVRENFDTRGFPVTVIDFTAHAGQPWHDMHLMSLCRHHVIANSSFSWWGAWLSTKGGIVCCPENWFASESGMEGHPAPERWIRL